MMVPRPEQPAQTPTPDSLLTLEEQHWALTLLSDWLDTDPYDADGDEPPRAETAEMLRRFESAKHWRRG